MTVALLGSALSHAYRNRFEQDLGTSPHYVTARELRKKSLLGALRVLGSDSGGHVVIPFEDPDGRTLVPILQLIAAVSTARRIEVVRPDLGRERVSRLKALRGGLAVAWATLRAWWAVAKAGRQISRLKGLPRRDSRTGVGGRIVYIKANLSFGIKVGGSVGHVAGVVNELKRRGHEVDVAAVERPAMLDPEVGYRQVVAPETFGLPPEINHYRLHEIFDVSLSTAYKASEVAFVYQRMSTGNWSGVRLSRRLGRPLVLEYNGSEAWIAKHWGTPLRLHELAVACEDVNLQHAHVVVTVSQASRDELHERGVEDERIVVYPNCIDPNVFDPTRYTEHDIRKLRNVAGLPDDATVVGFMGTFGRWHGVEVLAEAIREILDGRPLWADSGLVCFLLVGDGAGMPAVKEILGPHLGSERVRLTGLVGQDEAPAYLAACDILVSPHVTNEDGTRFFGSPTKLFEYMAMGRAVVASDLEQIGEVMAYSYHAASLPSQPEPSPGESSLGVLVRPGSREDLREAIRFMVENPKWRRTFAWNAHAEVREKYTWHAHVSKIMEHIRALKSHGGGV